MGNSKSQVNARQKKRVYLLYVINRTWNRLRMDREQRRSQSDRDTEISSRCSGCKGCDYNQDSLIFDSESEMAPNAEEEMLAVKPWGLQQDKERLRPPTYNAEDYAIALRRWGRRPVTSVQDSHGTLPSTTSSSSGYVSGSGEMTLRQFTSVSELLNKLRADLRLAFPSFVQEFSSSPADGITLLLETLRGVQLVQSTPPSGQTGPRIGTRRAALDELGCVECLAACAERCADAPRLLSQAQPGLLALAVCLTSSLNRSRVLALQLLTKVCQTPGGHLAVSEAVSTLRLRYGEGGRFRFLAGALLAPRAAIALRVAGISFLNAFLKSAPRSQTRLYIQAEACEAGLEPRVLQEWLTESDSRNEDALMDLLKKEVLKWSKNCVDVDLLEKRLARAEETCMLLTNKLAVLQNQLDKLKMEKNSDYNYSETNIKLITNDNNNKKNQRLSSNGEDEGISSSERSSTPEDLRQVKPIDNDNDQETTIDDVIEELRIIVKDAEEEDRMEKENSKESRCKVQLKTKKDPKTSKTPEKSRTKDPIMEIDTKNISANYYDDENNFKNTDEHEPIIDTGSLKIVVKGPEIEDAIIPAILYPQPPRRSPPCLSTILAVQDDYLDNPVVYNLQDDDEVEEETLGDGSDSLLSASRLKYNGKEQLADSNKFYLGKNGVDSKDSFKTKERSEKKTIRNFVAPLKLGGEEDSNRYHDVYRQFESTAKINGPMERHNSRYRKDPERKKLLRRSVSHDYLNSEQSSPNLQRSGSKIEGKIRKFESLNSFDNSSLINFTRSSNRASRTRAEQFKCDNSRKIRRSESCHHVSHPLRKSSKSGSDSGLHYITDYDLQPVMAHAKMELELGGQLTKSLDRIDEGLDTMVDIVIGGNDRKWLKNCQIGRGNNLQSSRSCDPGKRQVNSSRNKGSKNDGKGSLKNDELYNGVYSQTTLRNDELYREDRSQWNISGKHGTTTSEKIHNFTDNNLPIISSFYQGKGVNRFSMNESGVFSSTGRPYDAFGLGKNRFNAGKYSGNPTTNDTICVKRNSVASNTVKRGKVTDIISGLY